MESVVCSTWLTIASTRPHHTVDSRRNRGVCRGWHNSACGFGGGVDFMFKVLGRFGVSLVRFEVDWDLKFGLVGVELEYGEDDVLVSVS